MPEIRLYLNSTTHHNTGKVKNVLHKFVTSVLKLEGACYHYDDAHRTKPPTVNPEYFVGIKVSYVGDLRPFVRMKFRTAAHLNEWNGRIAFVRMKLSYESRRVPNNENKKRTKYSRFVDVLLSACLCRCGWVDFWPCVCEWVCVCVRQRERECVWERECVCLRLCICVYRQWHTQTHTHTHTHTYLSVLAWQEFFFCLYSSCARACVTQCAFVVVVILKCSTFLAVISK